MAPDCRNFQVFYYHRLAFPSASGQTVAIIRDFHGLSRSGPGCRVRLFYRSAARPAAAASGEIETHVRSYGATLADVFRLVAVPAGGAGRRRLRNAVIDAIDPAAGPVFLVARTFTEALAAVRLRRRCSVPVRVIMELHQDPFPHLRLRDEGRRLRAWRKYRAARKVFSAVDAIVCTAAPQIDFLDRLFPGHAPTMLLPNGCPEIFFRPGPATGEKNISGTPAADFPRHQRSPGLFHLRYAGQFSSWKQPEILIDTLCRLPDRFVLDIAGGKAGDADGAGAALIARAREKGVARRLSLFGFLPPVDVPDFLQGADCLLLPLGHSLAARLFTSPLKLFEYAAAGRPVVATRQPSTECLVDDGEQALLVPPDDPAALARAVERIAADPDFAAALAGRARAWAEGFATPVRMAAYRRFLASLTG